MTRSEVDEAIVSRVLTELEALTRRNFHRYRVEPMRRRIRWRMASIGESNVDDYVARLKEDAREASLLVSALLIKTTSMFRDRAAFDTLRAELPRLVRQRIAERATMVRAWVPACSTGQEAFSIALALAEVAEEAGIDWRVVASDIDPTAIEATRQARIADQDVPAIPDALRDRWLVRASDGWALASSISSRLTVAEHDVIASPVPVPASALFASFDLVSCRNLLIYLKAFTQAEVCLRLVKSCAPGALLFLGCAETIPQTLAGHVELVTRGQPVYRVWGASEMRLEP